MESLVCFDWLSIGGGLEFWSLDCSLGPFSLVLSLYSIGLSIWNSVFGLSMVHFGGKIVTLAAGSLYLLELQLLSI